MYPIKVIKLTLNTIINHREQLFPQWTERNRGLYVSCMKREECCIVTVYIDFHFQKSFSSPSSLQVGRSIVLLANIRS
jgi:hypothetical protein